METKFTFCRICESLCGLKINIEKDEIISISPDRDHIATGGFSCIKGRRQHEIYQSPDRLKHPLKRMKDGSYEEISWDQAMKEIGQKVRQLKNTDGPDSIGMYVGTAAGFSVLHPVFAQGFMSGIGSKSMYSSSTQDCSNKFAVSRLMYGFPFTQPFPDLENINCLIIVGANPLMSKWSFLQVNNPSKQLQEIEKRGGKIYFVDPRRTESASIAGKHIFIRPGTDVFFFLSFLNELISQKGLDIDKIQQFYSGFEEVKLLIRNWDAAKTSKLTGIEANDLKNMVSQFVESNGSAIYSSTGVNMGGNGSLAFWIQEVINAVSGNLDKKGGTLVGKGIIDFLKFGVKNGILMRDDKSRIGSLPSVNDGYAGGILADEILTEGEGQIKAMFVTGGNPLITMANSQRLKKAFESLELLVTLDIHQNETSSIAHYVLPTTDPFQRPDLPFVFPLMLGLQQKPYLQATKALVSPKGNQRDEASIYLDLAQASGVSLFGSALGQKFFKLTKRYYSFKNPDRIAGLPQQALLNGILRLSRKKSFNSLLKHPHGFKLKKNAIGSFLGKRIHTKDRKVNLAPTLLLEYSEKLHNDFKMELDNINKFKLITKRSVTTHNSWTHNTASMLEKEGDTNYAYLHPDDLNDLNLSENDFVDITSTVNSIRLPVKPLETLLRKTIAVPHGWGHQSAKGMNIANKTKGVNVNILAADGPGALDKISGMAHLTGFFVDIEKSTTSGKNNWAGI